jgi:2-amino-4-hydroxy-6-hydroxymethyldihydropteridine diphosphokinase
MKMPGIIRRQHPKSLIDMTHTAFISIGSNMGDKLANCHAAIQAIEKGEAGRLVEISPFYKTEPVDYANQDWFLNAALKIETRLAPLALLSALQKIQNALGRKSGGVRFGPRIIDLDIIFYDDLVFNHENLVIPHPRMHKRRFVLQSVCDIDRQIVHPGLGQNVGQLLDQIDDDNQGVCIYPCAC